MDTAIVYNNGKIIFGDPEKNIESSLVKIKESADYLVQRNRELSEQLNQYDENAGIKAKEDKIRSIYQRAVAVLSPVEHERCKAFREHHYQFCKNGGRFIYDLQGTGIGTIVKIKCPICGIEKDITDAESW